MAGTNATTRPRLGPTLPDWKAASINSGTGANRINGMLLTLEGTACHIATETVHNSAVSSRNWSTLGRISRQGARLSRATSTSSGVTSMKATAYADMLSSHNRGSATSLRIRDTRPTKPTAHT